MTFSSNSINPQILVAEDNLVNQRIAAYMLEKLGYQVQICANGREAVQAFQSERFACILMDGFMPEMDGFEAAREIRRLEHSLGKSRTPIIALTASIRPEDRDYCKAAGMDDFLSKPVSVDTLAATLSRWIPESGAS